MNLFRCVVKDNELMIYSITRFFLSALIMSFFLVSCGEEEVKNGRLDLRFKLRFNGEPLVTGNVYDYPLGYPILLTKFSFFLSDIQLHNSEGEEELLDVAFLNLTQNQQSTIAAGEGTIIQLGNIPYGKYSSLSLNLGIPPDVNAMAPADFSISNPLSNTGEYWEGWLSYIFHKTEGRIDLDLDGDFETAIALHIGSNAAFRSKVFTIPIVINAETKELIFEVDVLDVLNINGQYYDLEATPQIHHEGLLPIALPLMDNLINAFD